MSKLIDLTGMIFGRLKVLRRDTDYVTPHNGKVVKWLCECIEGNIISTTGYSLRSGHTQSCGCYNRELINNTVFIDLIGKRFGRLLVIKRSVSKDKKRVMWECKCDCGNTVYVLGASLKSGNTKSCGCYSKEVASKINFKDLTGKIFGRLTVIKLDCNTKNGYYWICKCVEGNVLSIAAHSLLAGRTKSCGCLFESYIASELKIYFKKSVGAIPEYRVFKNPETNYYLPYDIYFPKENAFIEVHGKQHYKFSKHFHKTEEEFKYQKSLDKMKRKYARKNGIYIEIDLRKIKTIEEGINYISNILEEIKNGA